MGATLALNECVLLYLGNEQAFDPIEPSFETWIGSTAAKLNVPFYAASPDVIQKKSIEICIESALKLSGSLVRNRLLIAGNTLENAISVVTLTALVEGFDVYLLADLISVSNQKFEALHWQRLIQAGAVPTSIAQILFEWKMSETDLSILSDIDIATTQFHRLQMQA